MFKGTGYGRIIPTVGQEFYMFNQDGSWWTRTSPVTYVSRVAANLFQFQTESGSWYQFYQQ